MSISLSRNTKCYISTVKTGFNGDGTASTNTWEVPILDGYTFSQDVETNNITLSEAACTPVRGQKIFNTALNPVDISFSTYMKPYDDGVNTDAVERILWEAFCGPGDGSGGMAWPAGNNATRGNPSMSVSFSNSNTHELLKINVIFVMDKSVYMIEDVGLNVAEVDFSIDGIAMITWTGQGAALTPLPAALTWTAGTEYLAEPTGANAPQFIKNKLSQIEVYVDTKTATAGTQEVEYDNQLAGTDLVDFANDATLYTCDITIDGNLTNVSLAGTALQTDVTAALAALDTAISAYGSATLVDGNVLITSDTTGSTSTVVVVDNGANPFFANLSTTHFLEVNTAIDGLDTGKDYIIPITGGSLTLTNNVTYLTPEELGKVNVPIAGGFTGTREFGGTLNAYLNTGANKTGGLLDDLTTTAALQQATNRFWFNISVGGCNSSPKVEFTMPYAHLVIPTVSVEDVISTEIGFTALGSDITQADELTVTYSATL